MHQPQNEYYEPWISESSRTYLEELNKEVSEDHLLYGVALNVVARRIDKDEILFQFKENSNKYVQVHLTWKQDKEIDPKWPISRVFNSYDEWVTEVMLLDKKEYEE